MKQEGEYGIMSKANRLLCLLLAVSLLLPARSTIPVP